MFWKTYEFIILDYFVLSSTKEREDWVAVSKYPSFFFFFRARSVYCLHSRLCCSFLEWNFTYFIHSCNDKVDLCADTGVWTPKLFYATRLPNLLRQIVKFHSSLPTCNRDVHFTLLFLFLMNLGLTRSDRCCEQKNWNIHNK